MEYKFTLAEEEAQLVVDGLRNLDVRYNIVAPILFKIQGQAQEQRAEAEKAAAAVKQSAPQPEVPAPAAPVPQSNTERVAE